MLRSASCHLDQSGSLPHCSTERATLWGGGGLLWATLNTWEGFVPCMAAHVGGLPSCPALASGILNCRALAAALVGLQLLCWFSRNKWLHCYILCVCVCVLQWHGQ